MRKSRITKVTLRYRMLSTGKESLYLDYYPGIPNPETGETMRREYLGLYVTPLKKRNGEPQTNKDGAHKYREEDAETIRLAQMICAKRQNELSKSAIYTDVELEMLKAKERSKGDFIAFFRDMAKSKVNVTYRNWMSALKHLQNYTMQSDSSTEKRFCDIDLIWCERFRDYLLNATNKYGTGVLSNNTAALYVVMFKSALRYAYKRGYLQKNINEDLKGIKSGGARREFLSLDELRKLVEVPCRNPVLKRAALFSALTGLRHSDIIKMKWGELSETGGKFTLRYTIQKTGQYDELPISEQAMRLCGERKNPDNVVFDGLIYSSRANRVLKQWLVSAGITRKVTFHCFRHTFATLQLASGTQITTISKMLGHKNIATTLIYAKTLEEAKREAADKLKIF